VMEAVASAVHFAQANVRHVAGILALVMVANIAGDVVGGSAFGIALGSAITVLIGVIANGALLRLAFADEHPGDPEFRVGPQGFQWGKPETRLLGAVLLVFLFALLALLFVIVLAVIIAIATMALGHPNAALPTAQTQLPQNAQVAISVMGAIFAFAALWVAVRICLYPAATVAEKKVQVFSTWRLTHGNFWRILATVVLVMAPAILLACAITVSTAFPAVQGVLTLVFAAVSAFVVYPMIAGLYAYLYRALRPVSIQMPTASDSSALAGPWGSV
jgi:hypothetical protein